MFAASTLKQSCALPIKRCAERSQADIPATRGCVRHTNINLRTAQNASFTSLCYHVAVIALAKQRAFNMTAFEGMACSKARKQCRAFVDVYYRPYAGAALSSIKALLKPSEKIRLPFCVHAVDCDNRSNSAHLCARR